MKKTTFLILVIAAFSCNKKENDDNAGKDSLVNKWEIRKSIGGFVGTVIYQPGTGSVLEIKSDNTYAYSYKGTIGQTGTYDLQSTSDQNQYKITFHSNMNDRTEDAILNGDTLVLKHAPECCDIPYNNTYVKVR